ncbi:hypothetical protein PVAND_015144 [Polypedilum vanderplanki]|uniref:Odorant binding protein n=1 Tax=Polypedilum vanderplanki TaxID=319348 RepID=A0A9J6BC69_POLVA|nr:hypothetical protein PVAND_015144 [Polypedilum vanderplanki]
MINLKFLFFFAIFTIAIAQEDLHDFTESVMAIQEYCEEKENVTMEFEFSSEEFQEADNHEWKCMLECVATELGIFRNHKFYDRGFYKMIKRIFPDLNQELNEVIKFITSSCETTVFDDRCEAGYEFMNCLQNVLDSERPIVNLVDFDL